jgi:flagellin-specific chaperone FliS
MNKYSNEFLNKTIKIWQSYSLTPLSLNDAREITENMTALFNLLINNDGKSKGIKK